MDVKDEVTAINQDKKQDSRIKTPVSLRVGKHLFLRYLMCNEYAEEMKCRCGLLYGLAKMRMRLMML